MVKFITYKKQDYPVRVSYLAIKMTQAATKRDLTTVETSEFKPEELELMLYWALKSGATATGNPFTFEMSQMEEVLDDCFMEFTEMIPLFFKKKELGEEAFIEEKMERLSQLEQVVDQTYRDCVRRFLKEIYELAYKNGQMDEQLKNATPQT